MTKKKKKTKYLSDSWVVRTINVCHINQLKILDENHSIF